MLLQVVANLLNVEEFSLLLDNSLLLGSLAVFELYEAFSKMVKFVFLLAHDII